MRELPYPKRFRVHVGGTVSVELKAAQSGQEERSIVATVRAKFQVIDVKKQENTATGEVYGEEVKMIPVYSPDPTTENHQFWTATPSGELTMWINNPQAFGKFPPGQQFYLDFTPA